MFFYEGFSCPVCGKPFSPEDDVVACPTCGAPHHRHCWQKQGHCHFEEDHGTDRQWSRERQKTESARAASPSDSAQRRCPHCGHENPAFAEFCAHCGRPTGADDWQSAHTHTPPPQATPFGGGYTPPYGEYRPFHATIDPLGGVAPDEELEGVPAEELATFVGNNTAYYLPRFRRFSREGSKCNWNWAAFFLTPYWLLYRKQYVAGVLVLVFEIVRVMVECFILYGVMQLHTLSDSVAMSNAIIRMSADSTYSLFIWVWLLTYALQFLIQLLVGLSGNWLYFRTAVSRIRKLKGEAPTVDKADLAVSGGVSLGLGVVGYVLWTVANLLAQYIFVV